MTANQNTNQRLLDGRMKRGPYVVFSLTAFFLPFLIAWGVLYVTDFANSKIEWGLPLGMVVFALTTITHLVGTGIIMVRRANDCGKDRSLAALLLIPVANLAILIYLMFPPSHQTSKLQ